MPPSKLFVHVNPVQINFHLESILWLNSFALNLHKNLLRTSLNANAFEANESKNEPNIMYMDVKMEAIMPRVIIESLFDVSSQRDRPKIMQIQVSRFTLTNIRETGSSRADLANALHSLQEGSLIFASGFPSKNDDLTVVTDRILSHVSAADVMPTASASNDNGVSPSQHSRHILWTEPRDVWCAKLDPVWVDFLGARSVGANKAVPFVDAVPIALWIHGHDEVEMKPDKEADFHIIAHVSNLVSLQIDHFQCLFLLRLAEEMTELSAFLSIDSKRILENEVKSKSIVIGCVVPQLEVTLVMPSQTPGKESSGGDGESASFVVDDSNVNGSAYNGSTAGPWQGNVSIPLEQLKNSFGSIETPSPVLNEKPESFYQRFEEQKVQINSMSAVTQSSAATVTFATSSTPHHHNDRAPAAAVSSMKSKNRNSITDAGLKEIGSIGLSSMKKGFSSWMTSIDSALKNNPNDDISDTISIQSDVSSDSENFIMVLADDKTADCMDMMFRLNPFVGDDNPKASTVEVASEVCEEIDSKTNASSPSEPSETSTWRRRDLVSMVTFRYEFIHLFSFCRRKIITT